MEDLHFMVDKAMIKRIVDSADVRGETVLEIGAGHGELTEPLSRKAGRVVAIEKDKKLAFFLKKRFRKNRKIQVVHGNALKEMEKIRFGMIVSNLPYSICEPLFQRLPFLEFKAGFFALPKGFSKRLKHLPYSCLLETETIFEIPKTAFSPRPRTSSVFVETKKSRESLLGKVLFRRRSKLKNAIKEALFEEKGVAKRQAKEALKALNSNTLLEKRVRDLALEDLKNLDWFLKSLEKTKKI